MGKNKKTTDIANSKTALSTSDNFKIIRDLAKFTFVHPDFLDRSNEVSYQEIVLQTIFDQAKYEDKKKQKQADKKITKKDDAQYFAEKAKKDFEAYTFCKLANRRQIIRIVLLRQINASIRYKLLGPSKGKAENFLRVARLCLEIFEPELAKSNGIRAYEIFSKFQDNEGQVLAGLCVIESLNLDFQNYGEVLSWSKKVFNTILKEEKKLSGYKPYCLMYLGKAYVSEFRVLKKALPEANKYLYLALDCFMAAFSFHQGEDFLPKRFFLKDRMILNLCQTCDNLMLLINQCCAHANNLKDIFDIQYRISTYKCALLAVKLLDQYSDYIITNTEYAIAKEKINLPAITNCLLDNIMLLNNEILQKQKKYQEILTAEKREPTIQKTKKPIRKNKKSKFTPKSKKNDAKENSGSNSVSEALSEQGVSLEIKVNQAEVYLLQSEYQKAKQVYNDLLATKYLLEQNLSLYLRVLLGLAEYYNRQGYELSLPIDLMAFYDQGKNIDSETFEAINKIKEYYNDALECCKQADIISIKLLLQKNSDVHELENLFWMKNRITKNINFNLKKINKNYEDYLDTMSALKERLRAKGLYGNGNDTGPSDTSISTANLQIKYDQQVQIQEEIISLNEKEVFFVNDNGNYLIPSDEEVKNLKVIEQKYFMRVGYLFPVTICFNEKPITGYIFPVYAYYTYSLGPNTMPELDRCISYQNAYFYSLEGPVSYQVFRLQSETVYSAQEFSCSTNLANKNPQMMFTQNPYLFFNKSLPVKRRNSISTLDSQKVPSVKLNSDRPAEKEGVTNHNFPQSSL